jgi:hypothetical protein
MILIYHGRDEKAAVLGLIPQGAVLAYAFDNGPCLPGLEGPTDAHCDLQRAQRQRRWPHRLCLVFLPDEGDRQAGCKFQGADGILCREPAYTDHRAASWGLTICDLTIGSFPIVNCQSSIVIRQCPAAVSPRFRYAPYLSSLRPIRLFPST